MSTLAFHSLKKLAISLSFLIFTTATFAQTQESSWPKTITANEYIISVYAPQNAEYVDLRLKSNSAVSVKKGDDGTPTFGMMWTTSILDVDRESKMASLASINVDEVRFPESVNEEQKNKFKAIIEKEVPNWEFEFSLTELIDSIKVVSSYQAELDNNPPAILFATVPSVLVLVDGEPKFKEADSGFEVIINSAAFLIHDTKGSGYYLRGGSFWYKASNPMGPWENTNSVPKMIDDLLQKSGLDTEEEKDTPSAPPAIVMASKPSELIVTEGESKFSPLQNTNLLYVENTESDFFMNITDQNYYLLISGRWFQSKDLKTGWSFIDSEKLPADFQKIDKNSAKASVRASVAGTKEAQNALYDAQIPQTAAVEKTTKAETVTYNGEPKFEKIKGLNLEYALNTESSVFKDGERYFLCDNAIWFQSNSPKGPWKVSEERPEQVDEIPADNPQYNTKYVYIYETSPTVVYVGYTPGYYGSYVYGNTVVYGTGFYYNPWYAGNYYHYHYSYGFSVRYNPYNGWSVGFSFGSPYGWYGNAYWGAHYHWGPSYYRPPYYRPGYRPVPCRPVYANHRGGVNRYNRPSTLPAKPTTRPQRPNTGTPTTRPSRPTTQPSKPATRPTTPSSRPSTQPASPATKPATRPSQTTRPSSPSHNYSGGGARPSTRPSAPAYRPAARPTTRPAARPMNRPSGGRMGGRR